MQLWRDSINKLDIFEIDQLDNLISFSSKLEENEMANEVTHKIKELLNTAETMEDFNFFFDFCNQAKFLEQKMNDKNIIFSEELLIKIDEKSYEKRSNHSSIEFLGLLLVSDFDMESQIVNRIYSVSYTHLTLPTICSV